MDMDKATRRSFRVEIHKQEGGSDQDRVIEENVTPTPMPPSPPPVAEKEPVYDISRLPLDPGERQSIANYPVNDQEEVVTYCSSTIMGM